MANFPVSNLDLLSSTQSQKEVTANRLFDAASPAATYGYRASTSTGLTWGYYGGTVNTATGPVQFSNGTLTLSPSTTNYIEYDQSTGVISVQTSGWRPLTHRRVYLVVTNSTTFTSAVDWRVLGSSSSGNIQDDRISTVATPTFNSYVFIPQPTANPSENNQIAAVGNGSNLILGGLGNSIHAVGSTGTGGNGFNTIINSFNTQIQRTTGICSQNVKIGYGTGIFDNANRNTVITTGTSTVTIVGFNDCTIIGNVGNITVNADGLMIFSGSGTPITTTASRPRGIYFGPGGGSLTRTGEWVWTNEEQSSSWKRAFISAQWHGVTTTSTANELLLQLSGTTTNDRFFMKNNSAIAFSIMVTAKQSGTGTARGYWILQGLAFCDGSGNVTINGLTNTLISQTGLGTASVSLTAGAGFINLSVTPGTTNNIRWHAVLEGNEVVD